MTRKTPLIDRVDIQTVTEEMVRVAFTLARPERVKVTLRATAQEATARTVEVEVVGRVEVRGLAPDTDYQVIVEAGDATHRAGVIHTPPAPQGPCRARFAVLGDPHISLKPEICAGRLFPESTALLREILHELAPQRPEFLLMAGDVTNKGTEEEYRRARELLAAAPFPVLAVAGDHDCLEDPRRFAEYLGPLRWSRSAAGFRVIGCHTGAHVLGAEGLAHLRSALAGAGSPVLLLSHMQFLPDDYIIDADRAIEDAAPFERDILPALPPGSIAYIGHKNVAAQCRRGNLLQLNVPQPVQYSCGYLFVRCHDNGLYHQFQPIFSEILNDVSRRMGNALPERNWHDDYRRGRGCEQWNFLRR